MVWLMRATFLLAPVVAVGVGLAGAGWFLCWTLIPANALSMWLMPDFKRQQLFGRSD
jgi:hypothetical protein